MRQGVLPGLPRHARLVLAATFVLPPLLLLAVAPYLRLNKAWEGWTPMLTSPGSPVESTFALLLALRASQNLGDELIEPLEPAPEPGSVRGPMLRMFFYAADGGSLLLQERLEKILELEELASQLLSDMCWRSGESWPLRAHSSTEAELSACTTNRACQQCEAEVAMMDDSYTCFSPSSPPAVKSPSAPPPPPVGTPATPPNPAPPPPPPRPPACPGRLKQKLVDAWGLGCKVSWTLSDGPQGTPVRTYHARWLPTSDVLCCKKYEDVEKAMACDPACLPSMRVSGTSLDGQSYDVTVPCSPADEPVDGLLTRAALRTYLHGQCHHTGRRLAGPDESARPSSENHDSFDWLCLQRSRQECATDAVSDALQKPAEGGGACATPWSLSSLVHSQRPSAPRPPPPPPPPPPPLPPPGLPSLPPPSPSLPALPALPPSPSPPTHFTAWSEACSACPGTWILPRSCVPRLTPAWPASLLRARLTAQGPCTRARMGLAVSRHAPQYPAPAGLAPTTRTSTRAPACPPT